MSRYLVRPLDDGSAQPGSDARYRENNLPEDFAAQRERDVKFYREHLLYADHMSVYVADCRDFIQDIHKTEEEMLCNLKRDRHYLRRNLHTELHLFKLKIRRWMEVNSHAASALKSLQNAPATDEERSQFPAAIALYPDANRRRVLIEMHYNELEKLQVGVNAQRVVRLLESLIESLENLLLGRSWV